jgi:hypothetical protein
MLQLSSVFLNREAEDKEMSLMIPKVNLISRGAYRTPRYLTALCVLCAFALSSVGHHEMF